ncbi:hypothetical protein [Orrella marina]|nr:hypothetical protein [Orrella marina]
MMALGHVIAWCASTGLVRVWTESTSLHPVVYQVMIAHHLANVDD